MIYSLENIKDYNSSVSIIKKSRIVGLNNKNKYFLLESLTFKLSNEKQITIPKGFIWDGSSVPRFLWWLLPPEGDFEIGALIHDYLYVNKHKIGMYYNNRKFADKEMYKWSDRLSGTNKISLRNFDNILRYITVRIFGGLVWNNKIKIK